MTFCCGNDNEGLFIEIHNGSKRKRDFELVNNHSNGYLQHFFLTAVFFFKFWEQKKNTISKRLLQNCGFSLVVKVQVCQSRRGAGLHGGSYSEG